MGGGGKWTGEGVFHSRFSSLLVYSVDVDCKSPIMRETRRMREEDNWEDMNVLFLDEFLYG